MLIASSKLSTSWLHMAFMAPSPAKSTDSPLAATSETPKTQGEHNNLLDLMDGARKNVVAPALNSLAIEPVNTVANVVNGTLAGGNWLLNKVRDGDHDAWQVGKLNEFDTGPKPAAGTAAAYSQQFFGTAGSFVAYAAASKLMGRAMRLGGEFMPLELEIKNLKVGSFTRAAAQNAQVATVLGATTYAGLRDTKDGESHLSNAVSTFIGFSAFELGNTAIVSPRSGLLGKTAQRFTVGFAGGIAQTNVASLIQEHKFADNELSSGLAGGALNALMPAGHRAIDEASARTPYGKTIPHATEAAARLHFDAARALPRGEAAGPGSWADPKTLKVINEAARADLHLKVQTDAPGQTRIDQTANVVHLQAGDDPLSLVQELAHRRIFKERKYEQAFQSHAAEIHSTNPADPANTAVKEKYIQTRIEQEIAARTAQNEAAAKIGSTKTASIDGEEIRNKEGYGARFEKEANDFIRSNGKTRPEVDYARDAIDFQSRTVNGRVEHTFKNARMPGRDNNRFDQPDSTKVHFGYEHSGRITVDFPSGRKHGVNLGESINQVRIVPGQKGEVSYYFNGRPQPQLIVESARNQMKVAPANGDTVLITEVDHQGAVLNLSDGSKATLTGSGKLTVVVPGKPTRSADLRATPARFAVVERSDGSKLFQVADEAATQQVQLKIDPRVAPTRVVYAPPDEVPAARIPVRVNRLPVPPRAERPVQGGMPGTPSSQTYDGSDFPAEQSSHDDRYPLQPNIFHDTTRWAEGIDPRALPGHDMTNPQDVLIAKLELYGPLETHFANLGRHETDDSGWPW